MHKILQCALAASLFLLVSHTNKGDNSGTLDNAHGAICAISTSNASGVLLKNGYILTAAHCVDHNSNNEIDENEKIVIVRFDDEYYATEVLSLTNWTNVAVEADLALLKPSVVVPRVGVNFATVRNYNLMALGDDIVILSNMASFPTTIADGRLISKNHNIDRSNANVYFGSSGGGVFDGDYNLVGIVHAVGMVPQNVMIQIPVDEERTTLVMMELPHVLSNDSYFTNLNAIIEFMPSYCFYDDNKFYSLFELLSFIYFTHTVFIMLYGFKISVK